MKKKKKRIVDAEYVDELITSMRICSQCFTCNNCMFESKREKYEEEFGEPDFTCRSFLLDAASELLCDLFPD